MKKILLVTPRFPYPAWGACEQDRLAGMLQLRRMGYEVTVVAKMFDFQNAEEIRRFAEDNDLGLTLVPYEARRKREFSQTLLFYLRRIANPLFWDGATYEYTHPSITHEVRRVIEQWKPGLLWCDYTYLWPLYRFAKHRGIPIVTRASIFEPRNLLEEDGYTLINRCKYVLKSANEIITVRKSDRILSITPNEQKTYERIGGKGKTVNLPLRGLARLPKADHLIRSLKPLNVFFLGSSYNISHNREALAFILTRIAPALPEDEFRFFIYGKKIPAAFEQYFKGNIRQVGYVEDLHASLKSMDVALIPSLVGAGMQQKIFEPLTLGIPTVTSPRGLAGYPFQHGIHLLLAESAQEYVEALMTMRDAALRRTLSRNAAQLSESLFGEKASDAIVASVVRPFFEA